MAEHYTGTIVVGTDEGTAPLPETEGYIDNPVGAAFITLENRTSFAIALSGGVFSGGVGAAYQSVAALTRATVPIDPELGVAWQTIPSDGVLWDGLSPQFTVKRSCPYVLHNQGLIASAPLYPNPFPVDVLTSGGSLLTLDNVHTDHWLYVAPQALPAQLSPPAYGQAIQALQTVENDACIVAVTLMPQDDFPDGTAPLNCNLAPVYSFKNSSRFFALNDPTSIAPFAPGVHGAGSRVHYRCPGAVAIHFNMVTAPAAGWRYSAILWIGIPAT